MSKIKEYSLIEAGLAELSNKYATVHDVTTQDGYDQCKKDAKAVGKYRTSLESVRKEIKGPALERCRDIDDEAKRIQIEIAKVEDPLKLAYKSVDEKKKKEVAERLAKIEKKINQIRGYVSKSLGATSNDISLYIEEVDSIDCTEGFYDLTKEALIARKETLEHLNFALKQTIQDEIAEKKRIEQEAELEELRKIKAQQEEKQRKIDEQQREIDHQKELQDQEKQAAINAQLAEEMAAKAAKERDEQAKIDADNAEKKRLADVEKAAESARLAEIERQEEEKAAELNRIAKLEANKKHVGKIRGQAKECLMKNKSINEELAIKIVKMIAKGEIEHISINY